MTAYLDLAAFKLRTVMPSEFVDELETRYPGWVAQQLATQSALIDSRLRKRYSAPFVAPYPEAVLRWLTQIVTFLAAFRRGIDPADVAGPWYEKQHDLALAELKEAADSNEGLFDLPIAVGGDAQNSGIVYGGPRYYSEQSPYVWTDVQADTGRFEDTQRGGTRG